MTPLIENVFPQERIPHARQLHIHLDDCRAYFSKATEQFITQKQILRVPHTQHSREIALSNYWLFGHVNNSLAGRTFDEPEQVLEAITEFLDEI
jgi:hypothetical protein